MSSHDTWVSQDVPATLLSTLERSARPGLEEGPLTLPPECYTSKDFYAFEQRAIFGREWFAIGRSTALATRGDYFTVNIAGESLIAVRDKDGGINVLSNVCQHRGSLIKDGAGNCGRALLCPYHHWSYDLSGALVGAPYMKDTPGFKKNAVRLPSLPVRLWNGFIFTTLNPAGEDTPFPDLDRFTEFAANWDIDSLVGPAPDPMTVNWNWKVMMENAGECYHCTALHGDLHSVAPTKNTIKSPLGYEDNAFVTQIRNVAIDTDFTENMTVTFPVLPGLTVDQRWTSTWVSLPPNLFISLQHDNVHYFLLLPRGPETTEMRVGYLYPPETLERPDFETLYKESAEWRAQLMDQDAMINQGVQTGMGSRFAPQGPYSWLEESAHLFHRWLAERYIRHSSADSMSAFTRDS